MGSSDRLALQERSVCFKSRNKPVVLTQTQFGWRQYFVPGSYLRRFGGANAGQTISAQYFQSGRLPAAAGY